MLGLGQEPCIWAPQMNHPDRARALGEEASAEIFQEVF